MSARALEIIEALRARVQMIAPGNGYNTSAGQKTFVGRTDFDREADTFPLVSFGVPKTTAEAINTRTQTYTITATFVVMGFIAVPTDDAASNPAALQADLERALLRATTNDALLPLVDDYRWNGSAIDYAQDKRDLTRVAVELRAIWTEQIGADFP